MRSIFVVFLAGVCLAAGCQTPADVVSYFEDRFLRIPMQSETRERMVDFLRRELQTDNVPEAQSYMEDSLRVLLHLIMSLPEYQLS